MTKNREIVSEVLDFRSEGVFHFIGGDYKPWWKADDIDEIRNSEGEICIDGYSGSSPSQLIMWKLRDAFKNGVLEKYEDFEDKKPRDYLITVEVEVKKLRRTKEAES